MKIWDGIWFYLSDGSEHAFRAWGPESMPRQHDWIVFSSNDKQPYEVVRAIWRETIQGDKQYGEVIIEKVHK